MIVCYFLGVLEKLTWLPIHWLFFKLVSVIGCKASFGWCLPLMVVLLQCCDVGWCCFLMNLFLIQKKKVNEMTTLPPGDSQHKQKYNIMQETTMIDSKNNGMIVWSKMTILWSTLVLVYFSFLIWQPWIHLLIYYFILLIPLIKVCSYVITNALITGQNSKIGWYDWSVQQSFKRIYWKESIKIGLN